MKLVKTVGVLLSVSALTPALQRALGYAGVTWWQQDGNVYVLNASLSDMLLFCQHANTRDFLLETVNESVYRYQVASDKTAVVCDHAEHAAPSLYLAHAKEIADEEELAKALDNSRTFMSRALHRRNASCVRANFRV